MIIAVPLIAVVIIVVAVGVFAMSRTPAKPVVSLEGVKAFDFALKDLKGVTHRLSDYRGKTVFLHFWASWCSACKVELPFIQKLYEDSEKDKFVILCVTVGDDKSATSAFVNKNGFTFLTLLGKKSQAVRDYQVSAIPVTYLIDKKGMIFGKIVGSREWKWEQVKPLLK